MEIEIRIYNFKDEELITLAGFVKFLLKRDLPDLVAFSPKFDGNYVSEFEVQIETCTGLVPSKEETAELKIITNRLYATSNSLIGLVKNLSIYIKMAKEEVPISVSDFGITLLRDKVRRKDAEGILQNLHIVNDNIQKYKEALVKQGLTDEVIHLFTSAAVSIKEDNQKQYEIVSNRKGLVQNNIGLFNDLYGRIIEICEVGKAIYSGKDAKKSRDYVLKNLLKQVRVIYKSNKEKEKENNNLPDNEN